MHSGNRRYEVWGADFSGNFLDRLIDVGLPCADNTLVQSGRNAHRVLWLALLDLLAESHIRPP